MKNKAQKNTSMIKNEKSDGLFCVVINRLSVMISQLVQ
jgi:hypothetical protein